MKNYIGVKIVKAEPATKAEFLTSVKESQQIPEGSDTEEGYIVMYPDGYVSWSPKEVFEKAYRELDCKEFINAD